MRVLPSLALAVIVSFALAAMYWPFIEHPDEMMFFGYTDACNYTGPALFYTDYVWHSGDIPLWHPLIFSGHPVAGNPQYLIFYPPNLLRMLLTPSVTPWNTQVGIVVMAYFHCLLGGLGVLAFGRERGYSRLASFAAGIFFILSSAFTQRLFLHHQLILVTAWLPWTLCALSFAMRANGPRQVMGRYALVGAAFAMAILAGFPETTYFIALAMVLFWILCRAGDIVVTRSARAVLSDLAGGALAVFIALGISAALIFPAIEFAKETPRFGERDVKVEIAPSVEALTLMENLIYYPGSLNHEGLKGIGASALVLCLLGLFSRHRRDVVTYVILSVILMTASQAQSTFVLDWIGRLAPFPISSPGRLSMIAVFPMAMLAGLGLERLSQPFENRKIRTFVTGACLFLGLIITVNLYLLSISFVEGDPHEVGFFPAVLFPVAGLASALAGLWSPQRKWFVSMAAALVLFEAVYWRSETVEVMSRQRELFYQGSLETAKAHPRFSLDIGRESTFSPNAMVYTLKPQLNGYDPLHLEGFKAMAAPEGDNAFWRGIVEMSRWSDRPLLLMRRSFWLHKQVVVGPIPERWQPFPVPTTVYLENPPQLSVPVVAPESVPARPYSDNVTSIPLLTAPVSLPFERGIVGSPVVWKVPDGLPGLNRTLRVTAWCDHRASLEVSLAEKSAKKLAGLVGSFRIEPEAAGMEYAISLPDGEMPEITISPFFVDGAGTIHVESAEILLDREDGGEKIQLLSRTANSVEVEVRDLPQSRILSFIDFDYPGWSVYVDGESAPLLKAFSYFKAVEVPPGTHRVRFEYRSTVAYAGIAVSLGAVAATGLLVWWGLRRRRASPAPEPPVE